MDSDPYTNAWPRCNVVLIRAQTAYEVPAGQTIDVWFRLFDVDDPDWPKSGETDVDDDTDTKWGDNYPSGDPGGVLNDKPDTVGASTLIKVTLHSDDKDSVAAFLVITQPYPGNNWRFAASTNKEWLEGVYIDEDGVTLKDAEGCFVGGRETKVLTCWRYLHVEADSMGKPYDEGLSTALTDTELTDASKDWDEDQFNSYAEVWSVTPDLNDTPNCYWCQIIDTSAPQTKITASPGSVMRTHANQGDPYRIQYDDWGGHPDDLLRTSDISRPDTDALEAAFAEACITPVYDTGCESDLEPWHKNFGGSNDELDTYAKKHAATMTRETPNYWCVYIIACYEIPNSLYDNDPDEEVGASGSTIRLGSGETAWDKSMFYEEISRDVADQGGRVPWTEEDRNHAREYTVLHEIGHHFGLEHDHTGPNSAMWASITDMGEILRTIVPLAFKAQDIRTIRRTAQP